MAWFVKYYTDSGGMFSPQSVRVAAERRAVDGYVSGALAAAQSRGHHESEFKRLLLDSYGSEAEIRTAR